MYTSETVIILEWRKLPAELKDEVSQRHNFANDIFLEHLSEMSPTGEETWQDALVEANFHEYYADQCSTNGYSDSFDTFLREYGLTIDWWLKDQPFDFSGAKRILFRISW